MAQLCGATGFLAFNVTDLHPHGFVTPTLVREYPGGQEPSESDRNNPGPGVSFRQVPVLDDDGELVLDSTGNPELTWEEERRQLPSRGMFVDFIFRSRTKSANQSLAELAEDSGSSLSGLGVLGGGTGAIGIAIANTTFLGGISTIDNEIVWMSIESETRHDIPLLITDEVISSGVIELPGHIVSLMGIFKEPLALSEIQKDRVGTPLIYNASGIKGETTADAIFEGKIIEESFEYEGEPVPAVFLSDSDEPHENRALFDENNIAIGIERDDRVAVKRADNWSLPGQRHGFGLPPQNLNSVSTRRVQIDVDGLTAGDSVYATACLASDRNFREKNFHDAAFAELPGVGRAGGQRTILPIRSRIETWHFHPVITKVKSDGAPKTFDTLDEQFLLDTDADIEDVLNNREGYEDVEDWRLSGEISPNVDRLFIADKNGIHLANVTPSGAELDTLFLRNNLADPDWYDGFLQENNLEEFDASTDISSRDVTGILYDISIYANVLPDQDKIGYHRAFALALNSAPLLGVAPLDLIIAGRTDDIIQKQLNELDLSQSEFKTTGSISKEPEAWLATTCDAREGDFGSYYDGTDPNNLLNLFVPLAAGDFSTDWRLQTPIYRFRMTKKSRVFVEFFRPEATFDRRYSWIYVQTIPSPTSALSFDYTPFKNDGFLFFNDPERAAMSFHQMRVGIEPKMLQSTAGYPAGNHDEVAFDHDQFKVTGYNRTIGDMPSYSLGQISSNEIINICSGKDGPDGQPLTFDRFFSVDDIVTEETTLNNPQDWTRDSNRLYRWVRLAYTINAEWTVKDNNGVVEVFDENGNSLGDSFISLRFGANDERVLNNMRLPISKGDHYLDIDLSFYSGSPITLEGDLVDKVKWTKISFTYASASFAEDYFLNGEQTATAIDEQGNIHAFYTNARGNISCAVTYDRGDVWYNFDDIIRLVDGESATEPYVIPDKRNNVIYLFYKLNDRFVMVKTINPKWFQCEDQFVTYEAPSEFNADTPELTGIEPYTPQGRLLRQQVSYFVHGNSEDDFVIEEQNVSTSRFGTKDDDGTDKTMRFLVFDGLESRTAVTMDADSINTFSAFRDTKGRFRLFSVNDAGQLTIKGSPDYRTWFTEVSNMWVHKTFHDDDPDEDDLSIFNVQTIPHEEGDALFLVYFNGSAMYVRKFAYGQMYASSDFFAYPEDLPDGEAEDGSFALSEGIRDALSIVTESVQNPRFLVGTLTEDIINAVNDDDENLAVIVPYDLSDPNDRFLQGYEVDDNTKPVGYSTQNGLIRIYYKSLNERVHGLSINGDEVLLDVRRIYSGA